MSPHLRRLMSFRQAIAFRQPLLRAFGRICRQPDHGAGHRERLRQSYGAFPSDTAGARLIGIYDSQVAFGQSRVLLVWNRLIMPNGRSIVLERQAGADTAGYAGLEDEVDNHGGAQFEAALLSTLLGVGSELGTTTGTGSNADIITALRRGTSDSMNQTGQRAVQRNLNIQPTPTIRPGFPVRVIVNRDLVLEPYKGQGGDHGKAKARGHRR
jgi:hypothetical protein